ncbi:MAG: DVU0298 family protein [Desulfobulbaceae bacterium]
MSSRRLKNRVTELLAGSDLEQILTELRALPGKDVIHALFSAICRPEEPLRWHAVQAMGMCVALLAETDREAARIVVRRLLWSLNEESGGIGWGAPEALAEIMGRHQGLAGEYVHMLISYMRDDGLELCQEGNFLEHAVLQRGLLWGIGRLAGVRPEILREHGVAADLLPYLDSDDHVVRGLAARVLGLLPAPQAAAAIAKLAGDATPVSLYEEGALRTVTVEELGREALQRIRTSEVN